MELTEEAPVLEQSDAVTQIAKTITPTENLVYIVVIMTAGYATGKAIEKGFALGKKALAKRKNAGPTKVARSEERL